MKHNFSNIPWGDYTAIGEHISKMVEELQQLKQHLLSRGNRGDVAKAELIAEILGEKKEGSKQ